MRRVRLIIGLASVISLSACNQLHSPPEPDSLARWAEQNGKSLDAAAVNFDGTGGYGSTDDGNGYVFKGEDAPGLSQRIYFLPLATVEPSIEQKVRAAVFPSGVATFSPVEDGQPERRVAESELDRFYVQLTVVDGGALCDNLSETCSAVSKVSIIGKLKNARMLSKGGRWIDIDPLVVAQENILRDKVPDAGKVCGFDPERDRVPRHVASACNNLRRMDFAIDHGFTLNGSGTLVPLTQDALVTALKAFPTVDQTKGRSLGELEEGK